MAKLSNKMHFILEAFGVLDDVVQHAPVFTMQDVLTILPGVQPSQMAKSTLIEIQFPQGVQYYVCAIPADARLDFKKLSCIFELPRSRITFVKPEQVSAVCGYEVGAISPIGLPATVQVLADKRFQDSEMLWCGVGVHDASLPILTDLFQRITGCRFEDIAII